MDELVKTLTSQYNRLNEMWSKAESVLRSLHLSQIIEYRYGFERIAEDDPSNTIEKYISWVKFKGDWRICVGQCYAGDYCTDWKPIVECSVQLRASLTDQFKELKRLAIMTVKQNIKYLDKVIGDFENELG